MAAGLTPTAEDLKRGYIQDGPDIISVFNLPVPIDDVIAEWEAPIAERQTAVEASESSSESESLRNMGRALGGVAVGFGVGGVLVGAATVTSIEHGVPFDAGTTPMLVGGFGVLMASVVVWCREHR